eukprot:TRINITY_DN2516_c0_g1_i1.p1 TRINITY_DN2516_c0_g1~~TRINITY_DN2516_c0_g1_i1.p1  ORF type:complete len:410 (-),score=113.18 TRINITY_DN2516_c0_g1_i1:372-1601(-)
MVLEATMICLDYSEWMRNGDYTPTRLEAQRDAVISICLAKTDSSPENNVGILRSSSRGVEVLVTLTPDSGKLLSSMHDHAVSGSFDFLSAVQVAQLGLKHRQNKSLQQRIIVFVGSPVSADTNTLVNLAKVLKKNSVAVDIINFGEETANIDKLEAFISAVNNNENSHLLTIPPGPHNLSDALYGSPILGDGMGFEAAAATGAGTAAPAATGGAAGGGFEFGVDPNLDPELALALRLSYEEERARQEQLNKRNQDQQAQQTTPAATPAPEPSAPTKVKVDAMITDADDELDDEDELAQALALSVQTHQQDLANQNSSSNASTQPTSTTQEDVEMGDEFAEAMALSLQTQQSQSQAKGQEGLHQDPNFLSSVLSTLPGVDPNDPNIQQVLAALGKPKPDEKKDDKDSEKK